MNKSDLVDVIVEAAQVPKTIAGKTLENILEAVEVIKREKPDLVRVRYILCSRSKSTCWT